jgi:hypothetical protein
MPTQNPDSYLSYFTPGQMSHDTLEFIFVARHKLAERLLKRVAESVLTEGKKYTLLLGPRGMGKSHLVALTYHRTKAREDLRGKVAIAWLAEEEWGVGNLRDFYLVILRALAREYPESGLTAEISRLRDLPHAEIEGAAADAIRALVGDRTLLLLVENLEEIFRGLGTQGQWAFRAFLSEKPFVTILATTQSLFPAVQKQTEAFYGFFQETYLEELTAEEATELLEKVAERRGDADLAEFLKTPVALDRVRAVNDLAGGHPRIYLLFAHLLTRESLDELVTPFLRLLDELTPYYQSRMLTLSPQQRKIAEYLCDQRGAIQVKTIARDNLLKPQATAAQLGELEKLGYVRKTALGRESYYELREPLLRMVIELKRSHNTEPIRVIVDFLRRWYSRAERMDWLTKVAEDQPLTRHYLNEAINLESAMRDTPNVERANTLKQALDQSLQKRDVQLAILLAAEIIEKKAKLSDEIDWMNYAGCLVDSFSTNINPKKLFKECAIAYSKSINIIVDKFNVNTINEILVFRIMLIINMSSIVINLYKGDYILISIRKMIGVIFSAFGHELDKFIEICININDFHFDINDNDKKKTHITNIFSLSIICLIIGRIEKSVYCLANAFSFSSADIDARLKVFTHSAVFWLIKIMNESLNDNIDAKKYIEKIIVLYEEHEVFDVLSFGLVQSIPYLLSAEVSRECAEEWVSTWQEATREKHNLATSMALLPIAIRLKYEPHEYVMLDIPVEMRRLLNDLLDAGELA